MNLWDFGVFRSNRNMNECTIPCIIIFVWARNMDLHLSSFVYLKKRQIVWALASNHLHVLYIQLWVCVKKHATVVNKNSITSRIVKIRSPSLNHMSMISPPLIWKLLRANNYNNYGSILISFTMKILIKRFEQYLSQII